jgi:hypothetical protein
MTLAGRRCNAYSASFRKNDYAAAKRDQNDARGKVLRAQAGKRQ